MPAHPKRWLLVVGALLPLLGCARARRADEAPPQVAQPQPAEDAGVATDTVGPVPRPNDPCAEYNARKKDELSDDEHLRQYGCPKCPCACINGRITCAPCARCDPRSAPEPQPVPDPPGGER